MALFRRGKQEGHGHVAGRGRRDRARDRRRRASSSPSRSPTRSTSPYELTATFESANNLEAEARRCASPASRSARSRRSSRSRDGNGAARVTMEIEKVGLPIHKDARAEDPAAHLPRGQLLRRHPARHARRRRRSTTAARIPVNQTATPVQFGEVLTALQSDTREDLQDAAARVRPNALGNGGAQGAKTGAEYYNESLDHAADALQATRRSPTRRRSASSPATCSA